MLIEIHLLQNHSPSNPNRDDLGAPKTAWFGGKLRGRISSQCLKRSIRFWPEFQDQLKGHLGIRTKLFPHLVGERLAEGSSITDKQEQDNIVNACRNIARGEGKEEKVERGKKADERKKTPQLVFLQKNHVGVFVERLEELRGEMNDSYKFFCNPIATFKEEVRHHLEELGVEEKEAKSLAEQSWLIYKLRETALFTNDEVKPDGWEDKDRVPALLAERLRDLEESEPQRLKALVKKPTAAEKKQLDEAAPDKPKDYKKFEEKLYGPLRLNAVDIALFGRMTTSDAFEDVEAAVEVAHAISTNALQQEVDFFTAVDDMGLAGAGAGHLGESQFNSCTYYKYFSIDWNGLVERLAGTKPTDKELEEARDLAARAVKEFIKAAWYAVPTGKKKGCANNDPVSAILVEVKDPRIPTNYANAFVKPAAPTDEHDLIEDSIAKLGQYVGCTARSSGAQVKSRIWHAARGEALEYIDPVPGEKDGLPQQVPDVTTVSGLPEVLEKIRAAIGVGAAQPEKGAAS